MNLCASGVGQKKVENEKELFISDLDGTLLNRFAELSEYTKSALNSRIADGLNFSVATARTLASTEKILAGLTLNIPIVLMNGVLIYDLKQKTYIKINKLQPESVLEIIGVLREFETAGFMYELNDGELMTYYESLEQKPLRDFVEERKARYYKTFRHTESFSDISTENIVYFTLLDRIERLRPVYDALVSRRGLNVVLFKDTYSSEPLWYLEVFSEKASKQNAVEYLRGEYGYGHITGFGDNMNDLPLFAACDTRVAVENARDELKAVSDYICGANTDDGVAKWICALQ